jgi:3-hydroxyisobutyrate dehydrogenase-like beta-hydroxyacid dehydrogenase
VTRVAFLGLGIMGSRMAANLVRAGHEATVWNRTAAKAQAFAGERPRARAAETPRGAAEGAEAVFSMVVDGPQVEAVLLGDDGAAAGAAPGTLFVDCSTIGPHWARAIGSRLAARGLAFVDAPVTGSSPRAQDGTLTIMAGGTAADFARAEPLLRAIGRLIVHAGPLGQGQIVKLINNAVAAANAAVVGQALLVGARSGADLDALSAVMGAGSGASAMLELKGPAMRRHDYAPLFKLGHMLKDVRLCLEHGEDVGAPFPFAALTREILTAAAGLGHADDDFAALVEVLERSAGTRL